MSAREVADRYQDAVTAGDTEALRGILADDVRFEGPMAATSGVEDCLKGYAEMARITTSQEVQVQLADDSNALIWATLTTAHAGATPTATWLQVDGDRITAIRTVFNAGGAPRA